MGARRHVQSRVHCSWLRVRGTSGGGQTSYFEFMGELGSLTSHDIFSLFPDLSRGEKEAMSRLVYVDSLWVL
eukprot:357523-Chlamydomonas_euryale.AAC.10